MLMERVASVDAPAQGKGKTGTAFRCEQIVASHLHERQRPKRKSKQQERGRVKPLVSNEGNILNLSPTKGKSFSWLQRKRGRGGGGVLGVGRQKGSSTPGLENRGKEKKGVCISKESPSYEKKISLAARGEKKKRGGGGEGTP